MGPPTYRQSAKCSKPPPNQHLQTIQPNQSPVLRIVKLKVISLYMHYLDTNILLFFVLLTNIDDNIYGLET